VPELPLPVLFSPSMQFVNWSRPTRPIALSENEIHVWRAWLDVDDQERERLSLYLSAEERARARRLVFQHDREYFLVGRGRLRELLGTYLQRPPQSLEFRTGPYGKLSLAERADVRFNLTHSYGLALYAFAMNRELGIDTEKIGPEFATEGIAERYFSAAEQRELRELPVELRTGAFFLCWTRKEAYVKAHGGGLQIPLESFDVSLTPGKPETLRSADSGRWNLRSFEPAPEYIASIIVEGAPESLRFWDADLGSRLSLTSGSV
jgi:4'-phosphopantetheinyl transferase